MLEQLQLLVRLQALDKILIELEEENDSIPKHLSKIDQEEITLSEAISLTSDNLNEANMKFEKIKIENEKLKDRIRKAKKRLIEGKTQREFQAANAEIEENKDFLKISDDKFLETMENQEKLEEKKIKDELKFQKLVSENQEKKIKFKNRAKKIAKEIGILMKNRTSLCKVIEYDLMDQYDFIRLRRKGIALAPVSKGTCLTCRMQLPPQQFNELQKEDKIMTCPSCRRIIYWVDSKKMST